jgi:hypothetical protein
MSATKTKQIKVRVTPGEKKIICDISKRAGKTVSGYLRAIALSLPLPNFQKIEATKELLKINSDLARLGNLFKLAVEEGYEDEDLRKMVLEIRETQAILKNKIKNL